MEGRLTRYHYARVDVLIDRESGYVAKLLLNGEPVEDDNPTVYLNKLGSQGWKMINAETISVAGDYHSEVYYFGSVFELGVYP